MVKINKVYGWNLPGNLFGSIEMKIRWRGGDWMSRIAIIFLFFLFSCSTQEDVPCESGFGYLYKDGKEFACPFNIQKEVGYKRWVDINLELTDVYVLPYDTEDHFPLYMGFLSGWPTYGVSMKVPKSHFTKKQYTVFLRAAGKNLRECGEPREFIFHRIEENNDIATYHSILQEGYEKSENGKELFFGEKEMLSGGWYHVLKICDDRQNFILMGEI
jgi:hypothetical protein